jgi:tRNA(Ile)-lysidine synthase
VPLAVHRVDVTDRARLGTEDAARIQRQRCFRESGAPFVALAHHADDQAETLLLQLLRGAGPAGLAAMPGRRAFAAGQEFIRPLLTFPRSAILEFARCRGLRWIEDESNDDARVPRNHLRVAVLPLLEERFPGYRRTLARAAANAADAATLTAVLASQDLAPLRVPDGIDVRGLVALGTVRAANALRFWLAESGVRPPARDRLLEHLRQLSVVARDHRLADLPGERVLVVRGGVLRVERVLPDPGVAWSVTWNGESRIALPDGRTLVVESVAGQGLSAAALAGRRVEIANRAGGERLRIAANRPHRTLKNLFAEAGIPAWERDHVPLVRVDGCVVWACGVGGEPDFTAGPDDAGWLFRVEP